MTGESAQTKGKSQNIWSNVKWISSKSLAEIHKNYRRTQADLSRTMGCDCCIPSIKPILNPRQKTALLFDGLKSSSQFKPILHLMWKLESLSLEEEWRGSGSKRHEVKCDILACRDDLRSHFIHSLCFIKYGSLFTSGLMVANFVEMLDSLRTRTWNLTTKCTLI